MGSKPTGISGSRAATVLGVSEWANPFELWIELMEERNPGWADANHYSRREWTPTPAANWGLAFEGPIMDYIEQQTPGEPIEDRERHFVHGDLDYVSCHVDGIHRRVGQDSTLIEVKTVNPFSFNSDWGEPGSDEIPRNYQAQMQHNLMCSGLTRGELWVLVWPSRVEQFEAAGWIPEQDGADEWHVLGKADNPLKVPRVMNRGTFVKMLADMGYLRCYHIEANTATQTLMLNRYREWWDDYIISEKEPEITRPEDILRAIKGVTGTSWADDVIEQQNSAYNAIGSQIRKLEAQRKELKKSLLDWMRNNVEVGTGEEKKLILKDHNGEKLRSFDGRSFR